MEAAYKDGVKTGDAVRLTVMAVVDAPINALAPTIRDSVTEALSELSKERRDRPQAWRGVAIWRAIKTLIQMNGLDIGAGLAYYLLLALFPLVALIIIGMSWLLSAYVVRATMTELAMFYFPRSTEVIEQVIEYLLSVRVVASVIAVPAMLFGSLGLFTAANRGVNHVFGRPPKRLITMALSTFAIVLLAVLLFLVSVSMTIVFQVGLGEIENLPLLGERLNNALVVVAGAISIVAPILISGVVFTIMYKYLPNKYVSWGNATFGGLIAMIVFEVAKHGFFWFVNLASHRDVLYGSLSSVVLLLIWSHVGGVIFLYGAALTKEASELRPQEKRASPSRNRAKAKLDAEERRMADIELGRAVKRGATWRSYANSPTGEPAWMSPAPRPSEPRGNGAQMDPLEQRRQADIELGRAAKHGDRWSRGSIAPVRKEKAWSPSRIITSSMRRNGRNGKQADAEQKRRADIELGRAEKIGARWGEDG